MSNIKWTTPMVLRAKALREAGLSYNALAIVVSLDYGVTVAGDTARFYLQTYFNVPKDHRRYDPEHWERVRCNREAA